MNVRNVSSLIRDDITTIGVKFHDHESKVYTYKATKDLAGTLAEGVLVQARGKIKPVVVVRVDTNSKIDPDFAVNYKWAIVDSRTGQIVQRYMRKPYCDVYDKFPQKKGGVKRITR